MAANEKIQEGSNCEADNATSLCTSSNLEIEDLWEKSDYSSSFTYKFRPLKPEDSSNFTVKELNGLTYILGAAVAKLQHKKCRKVLVVSREELSEDNDIYRFCKIKNASCYPSTLLFQLGIVAFSAYKQNFRKFLYQNRQNVKTRLKEYLNYEKFDNLCQKCFETLTDKIFNTFIQGFLRDAKLSLKMKQKVHRQAKRNRKAIRMNLPG